MDGSEHSCASRECLVTRIDVLLRRVTPSASRAASGTVLTVHGHGLGGLIPLVAPLLTDQAPYISCTFGASAEFSTPAAPGPRGTLLCTPPRGASGRLPFALHRGDTPVPAARALSVLLSDSKGAVVLALSPSVGPASGTSGAEGGSFLSFGGATSVTVHGAALP